MSYIKILVHTVWGTKNREPLLWEEKREILFNHIRQNALTKNLHIDTIGGYTDHVHCLVSLGVEQSIAKVVQLIKGESSYWANKECLIKPKLEWAEDYFAESISLHSLQRVRDYINQQAEHHKKLSFAEEYDRLITDCGLKSG